MQQLRITKSVAVVGGGPPIAGATLEYPVVAQNICLVPAFHVVLRDDIAMPFPGYLAFVNAVVHDERLDGRHHGRRAR